MTTTVSAAESSSILLRRMKEGGFDFARIHAIDFYVVFPAQAPAQRAARLFRGESLNTQVYLRANGSWYLQVSKVMHASHVEIDDFEHSLEALVLPFGGIADGWGVTQEPGASSPELPGRY
ncbi:MAG: ribonuclease E inhibitor RraB [Pseudomonas sp.]|nr:ribonuclease E inhibitor RraB [Pseudomonas sp.]